MASKETRSAASQRADTQALAELNQRSAALVSCTQSSMHIMLGDTSVDAHHAGNAVTDRTNAPGASGSVDAHQADTTLALMSYNVGIQNAEPSEGTKWTNKYKRLRDDIESAFLADMGIQVLLLCESGNMFESIDQKTLYSGVTQPTGRRVYCTQELFEDLLDSINLQHILVLADPPYVALIDSQCWVVKTHEVPRNFVPRKISKYSI